MVRVFSGTNFDLPKLHHQVQLADLLSGSALSMSDYAEQSKGIVLVEEGIPVLNKIMKLSQRTEINILAHASETLLH